MSSSVEAGGGAQGASYDPHRIPRTPEEVFKDYRGRRAGMIKALTTDMEKFYRQCDPQRENLCLYGLPNETWEVNLPAEEVPPELPEPALGINFARDGMDEKDWYALVAVHSDAWLLAVAFYFGARFGFGQDDRFATRNSGTLLLDISFSTNRSFAPMSLGTLVIEVSCYLVHGNRRRLFNMINNLPTIYEVVSGYGKKQAKEKAPNGANSKNSKSSSKAKALKLPPQKEESSAEDEVEEEEHEQGETLCGFCRSNYGNDEFWICCDLCERWFHGKCVKVTPARAEHIKRYKCPICIRKRARA